LKVTIFFGANEAFVSLARFAIDPLFEGHWAMLASRHI
jgi:hypothetical protein